MNHTFKMNIAPGGVASVTGGNVTIINGEVDHVGGGQVRVVNNGKTKIVTKQGTEHNVTYAPFGVAKVSGNAHVTVINSK